MGTDAGHAVTGFDGSSRLVRNAREGGAGSFHVLDHEAFARDPRRLGDGFDVVVCNFSLLGARIDFLLRAMGEVLARRDRS